ncbi:MAG: PadR family transcriptional regulator [Candidatus Aenigmatarchaeota archaeon]|nr:PadR family transcriptional regulator [Nanoarchaeota archaeon]
MTTPSQRFEKSLTRDNLWIYILTLLKKREMYPYEIRDNIKKSFGFSPGNMTAYIVLRKLRSGGYVKVIKKDQGRGPERTFYKITTKGAAELKKASSVYKSLSKNF